ncbi:MAG: hypothetical protein JST92_21110, partial [Deltaproteobacteria bacterium]|nr:hypothetical protein [Deltaproteobacteria bacterium]
MLCDACASLGPPQFAGDPDAPLADRVRSLSVGMWTPAFTRPKRLCAPLALPFDLPRGPGTYRFDYAVDAQGAVTEVFPRGRVWTPEVYDAVKAWLRQCRFEPARDAQGTPAAVGLSFALRQVHAPYVEGVEGLTSARPLCGVGPPAPPEVLLGQVRGLVPYTYDVDQWGAVSHFESTDSRADPKLVDLVREWFTHCPHEPAHLDRAEVAMRIRGTARFSVPPQDPPDDSKPLDLTGAIPSGVTAPRPLPCTPALPLPPTMESAEFNVTVDRLGRATSVTPVLDTRARSLHRTTTWLQTCGFEPARDAQGKPVSALI